MILKKLYILCFIIIAFILVAISLNSCSKEDPVTPISERCDVIALNNLLSLPCTVRYYANITGNVRDVSVSYYIDSGKIKSVNPTIFPFIDTVYFFNRDSAKITASGLIKDRGSLVVSFYAWKYGSFITYGSDSCVK